MLFAAPELAPWVKAGGLGEVARDLPRALRALGVDLRLLVPAYPALKAAFAQAHEAARIDSARLLEVDAAPILYLLECDAYYAREGGAYGDRDGLDWPDNHLRFGLLSRIAALLGSDASPLDWRPQVVHCHDWPCGLAPAHLAQIPGERAASVMTVHNLAYQGIFPRTAADELGLPFTEGVEFHGRLSFLKAGLSHATRLSTVSPTYAREIRGETLGFGLEGLLRHRAADLRGILNGIDTDTWDPARDSHIASPYDADRLEAKRPNKAALQRELGLEERDDAPLLGFVGRLVEQKGADLVIAIAPDIVRAGAQLAVLGTGERGLEQALAGLAASYAGAIAARLDFSEPLAHRIEAGADLFLMPSRFEPCGLNQLYSMRYGTPPIVRRTGGLADSVTEATGFPFDEPTPQGLLEAVNRALAVWREPGRCVQLQRVGMARDSGWERAAREYLQLYRDALG